MITNPNYRSWSEDEVAEYQEEVRRLKYERDQARKWAANAGKHVSDPSREWGEEE
jgi:hypothetical protein